MRVFYLEQTTRYPISDPVVEIISVHANEADAVDTLIDLEATASRFVSYQLVSVSGLWSDHLKTKSQLNHKQAVDSLPTEPKKVIQTNNVLAFPGI